MSDLTFILLDNPQKHTLPSRLGAFFGGKGFASVLKAFELTLAYRRQLGDIREVDFAQFREDHPTYPRYLTLALVHAALFSLLTFFEGITSHQLHGSFTGSSLPATVSYGGGEHCVPARKQVLDALFPLWTDPIMERLPPKHVVSVLRIMGEVIEGKAEKPPSVPSRLSTYRTPMEQRDFPHSRPSPVVRPQVVPDQTKVASLQELGFTKEQAEYSLTRHHNNVERAAEYLFSNPNIPTQPAPAPAATAPATPASGEGSSAPQPPLPQVQSPLQPQQPQPQPPSLQGNNLSFLNQLVENLRGQITPTPAELAPAAGPTLGAELAHAAAPAAQPDATSLIDFTQIAIPTASGIEAGQDPMDQDLSDSEPTSPTGINPFSLLDMFVVRSRSHRARRGPESTAPAERDPAEIEKSEALQKEYEAKRTTLRDSALDVAMRLLQAVPEITFDLAGFLTVLFKPTDSHKGFPRRELELPGTFGGDSSSSSAGGEGEKAKAKDGAQAAPEAKFLVAINGLISDARRFAQEVLEDRKTATTDGALFAVLHLLCLILTEGTPSEREEAASTAVQGLVQTLLDLLEVGDRAIAAPPLWLSPALLLLELEISLADTPAQDTTGATPSPSTIPPLDNPYSWALGSTRPRRSVGYPMPPRSDRFEELAAERRSRYADFLGIDSPFGSAPVPQPPLPSSSSSDNSADQKGQAKVKKDLVTQSDRKQLVRFCIHVLRHYANTETSGDSKEAAETPGTDAGQAKILADRAALSLQAMFRLLVRLTLEHRFAEYFHHLGGVPLLLRASRRPQFLHHQIFAMIVLRHVIENKQILRHLLTSEIVGSFAGRNGGIPVDHQDLPTFCKNTLLLVGRNPSVYLESVVAACKLTRPHSGTITLNTFKTEEEFQKEKGDSDKDLKKEEGKGTSAGEENGQASASSSTSPQKTAPTTSLTEATVAGEGKKRRKNRKKKKKKDKVEGQQPPAAATSATPAQTPEKPDQGKSPRKAKGKGKRKGQETPVAPEAAAPSTETSESGQKRKRADSHEKKRDSKKAKKAKLEGPVTGEADEEVAKKDQSNKKKKKKEKGKAKEADSEAKTKEEVEAPAKKGEKDKGKSREPGKESKGKAGEEQPESQEKFRFQQLRELASEVTLVVYSVLEQLVAVGPWTIRDEDIPKFVTRPAGEGQTVGKEVPADEKEMGKASRARDAHLYRCFLLEVLVELVNSFPTCKADFVAYWKKVAKADAFGQTRSLAGYLLNDQLPFSTILDPTASAPVEKRRRLVESHWAAALIVALCSGDSHPSEAVLAYRNNPENPAPSARPPANMDDFLSELEDTGLQPPDAHPNTAGDRLAALLEARTPLRRTPIASPLITPPQRQPVSADSSLSLGSLSDSQRNTPPHMIVPATSAYPFSPFPVPPTPATPFTAAASAPTFAAGTQPPIGGDQEDATKATPPQQKRPSPYLINFDRCHDVARRFALDGLTRLFKQVLQGLEGKGSAAGGSLQRRYSHLRLLLEVTHNMLSPKVRPTFPPAREVLPEALVRVMLEPRFSLIRMLSLVLEKLDLSHPATQLLAEACVRPLEVLVKTMNKIHQNEKPKAGETGAASSSLLGDLDHSRRPNDANDDLDIPEYDFDSDDLSGLTTDLDDEDLGDDSEGEGDDLGSQGSEGEEEDSEVFVLSSDEDSLVEDDDEDDEDASGMHSEDYDMSGDEDIFPNDEDIEEVLAMNDDDNSEDEDDMDDMDEDDDDDDDDDHDGFYGDGEDDGDEGDEDPDDYHLDGEEDHEEGGLGNEAMLQNLFNTLQRYQARQQRGHHHGEGGAPAPASTVPTAATSTSAPQPSTAGGNDGEPSTRGSLPARNAEVSTSRGGWEIQDRGGEGLSATDEVALDVNANTLSSSTSSDEDEDEAEGLHHHDEEDEERDGEEDEEDEEEEEEEENPDDVEAEDLGGEFPGDAHLFHQGNMYEEGEDFEDRVYNRADINFGGRMPAGGPFGAGGDEDGSSDEEGGNPPHHPHHHHHHHHYHPLLDPRGDGLLGRRRRDDRRVGGGGMRFYGNPARIGDGPMSQSFDVDAGSSLPGIGPAAHPLLTRFTGEALLQRQFTPTQVPDPSRDVTILLSTPGQPSFLARALSGDKSPIPNMTNLFSQVWSSLLEGPQRRLGANYRYGVRAVVQSLQFSVQRATGNADQANLLGAGGSFGLLQDLAGSLSATSVLSAVVPFPPNFRLGQDSNFHFGIFRAQSTTERWNQEGRIFKGKQNQEDMRRLISAALLPRAEEEEKELKKEQRKQREEQEQKKKEDQERKLREQQQQAETVPMETTETPASAAAAVNATPVVPPTAIPPVAEAVAAPASGDTNMLVPSTGTQPGPSEPAAAGNPGSEIPGISQEFLDALPPDIREEVLEQEREERRRARQPPSQRGRLGLPPGVTLDTRHGAAVLSVPYNLVRDRLGDRPSMENLQRELPNFLRMIGVNPLRALQGVTERKGHKDGPALVTHAAVLALLRLLYLPQPLTKQYLQKLFLALCSHGRTRTELLSLLLHCVQGDSIIKEGSGDKHMFLGLQQGLTASTSFVGSNPMLMVRRCLEVLVSLSTTSQQVVEYYITELDQAVLSQVPGTPATSRKAAKGKGKEVAGTEAGVSKRVFPVVVLVSLLEKQDYTQNSILLDGLMQLLSIATRAINLLWTARQRQLEPPKPQSKTLKNLLFGLSKPTEGAEGTTAATTTTAAEGSDAGGSNTTAAPASTSTEAVTPAATTLAPPVPSKEAVALERLASSIPNESLQLVVSALSSEAITPKSFQFALSTLNHLCLLGDNRQIVVTELIRSSITLAKGLDNELLALLTTLHQTVAEAEASGVPAEVVAAQEEGGSSSAAVPPKAEAKGEPVYRSVDLTSFSVQASTQHKLARLLHTIEALYPKDKRAKDKSKEKEKGPEAVAQESESSSSAAPSSHGGEGGAPAAPATAQAAPTNPYGLSSADVDSSKAFAALDFFSLWKTAGEVLSVISAHKQFSYASSVLLPSVESLFLLAKDAPAQPHNLSQQTTPNGPPLHTLRTAGEAVLSRQLSQGGFMASLEPRHMAFHRFLDSHHKILNDMVRTNPALINGAFSILIKNPRLLDFDVKRTYFSTQLHKRETPREHYPSIQLTLRRDRLFEDSYNQIMAKIGQEVKYGRLNVRFAGEEGIDAGGVTREWFQSLAEKIFDPNYALFVSSAADKTTYQPNRASFINPDHLQYFKFVGRVIGKAIYDSRLLDAHFTRSFYKHILGIPVDYKDVEALDPEFYKSLVWMVENPIDNVLDLTFTFETEDYGVKQTVDLKPSGATIPVLDETKEEYIRLVSEMKLTTAIRGQLDKFLEGFHEVVPKELISVFNEQELELLISGLPEIDIDDWKNNTEYQNYTVASPQIQWFWRALRSFNQEERAKLVQFVTGSSKIPLQGFAQLQGMNGVQKFNICRSYGKSNRLPAAHTW